jgi:hypothetical protein
MREIAAWDSDCVSLFPGGADSARGVFDESHEFCVPEGVRPVSLEDEGSFYPTQAPARDWPGGVDHEAFADDPILVPWLSLAPFRGSLDH